MVCAGLLRAARSRAAGTTRLLRSTATRPALVSPTAIYEGERRRPPPGHDRRHRSHARTYGGSTALAAPEDAASAAADPGECPLLRRGRGDRPVADVWPGGPLRRHDPGPWAGHRPG